jgi:putative ABC transport system substrate-binding protein
MDRRKFIGAVAGGLVAAPFTTFAQLSANVPRIGFLGSESASNQANRLEALRAGLRELGYVEGKNLVVEVRWADGKYDRLPALAAELVNLRVSAIVASGTKATVAAKDATTRIPIVMGSTGDAVVLGVVTNLAKPDRNVTGWTFFGAELAAKRLELLKESIPPITQVAFLVNPADPPAYLSTMETTAKALKIGLPQFPVRGPQEFDSTFAAIVKRRIDAVVIQGDTMFAVNANAVADLAIKHQLPSAGIVEFAEAGGLIGNGVNQLEGHRRAAYFVDRILKGAKSTDLPVEQATKFELIINLRTAKAIGVAIPQSITLRADRVIE